MGWFSTVAFQPLIGEKALIDRFKETACEVLNPGYDDDYFGSFEKAENKEEWYYNQFKGDLDMMVDKIAEAYPGITFYGYLWENSEGDEDGATYEQVIFNKKDGYIFIGRPYRSGGGSTFVLTEGLNIRGFEPDEYWTKNPIEYQEIQDELCKNDNICAAYNMKDCYKGDADEQINNVY